MAIRTPTEASALFSGHDVPRDVAKEWFEKAAVAGGPFVIGHRYVNGEGVAQDYAKAREWFDKVAAAGEKDRLGDLSNALYARQFPQGLKAAERALADDPALLRIATNRAHALMYLGSAEEPREVFWPTRTRTRASATTWQLSTPE